MGAKQQRFAALVQLNFHQRRVSLLLVAVLCFFFFLVLVFPTVQLSVLVAASEGRTKKKLT